MAQNNPSLVGQVISGCEILQKTAEGGMGAVYRARHKALNRIVCVKILSPSLSNDKKAIELFLTEARAIAELDHPNIVNVYNVGKENGYYFIVMSFIEGQTLSALLKKNKILPVNQVLDLFDGVLKGLEAAHAKGIIHRDIKPSNILITPEGQAKLVDFGIAKKMDKTGATKTTELAGTAYFIAPEQALGKNLDTRADLYSIGASLFYVLTGQFPYNGKNTIEIIQKHLNNPVPNPVDLRKDLPAWLGPAVQKLMSKNPDDRFQTAKETAEFFRKMRAEDQLRLKSGRGGKEIDLGGDTSMAVAREDKQTSPTLRRAQRTGGLPRISSIPTQPTFTKSSMPQLNPADLAASDKQEPKRKPVKRITLPSAAAAPTLAPLGTAPTNKRASGKLTKKLLSLVLYAPLFTVLAGALVYTFYTYGKIASVHLSFSAGFLHNLLALFVPASYAPGQIMWGILCLALVGVVFACSSLKAFSNSTSVLLGLAIVSLLAGLFVPYAPFMELQAVPQFLFSAEYHLCYLLLAFVWLISVCFSINRSIAKGVLGAALVIFCLAMTFASTSLTIAPNKESPFFMALLYASLGGGLFALYYLLARSKKDSVLMPVMLVLIGVASAWMFGVSGLFSKTMDTLDVLSANVPTFSVAAMRNKKDTALQEELDIPTVNERFQVDKRNEFSSISLSQVAEELQDRIEKTVTPGTFDEEQLALFARLLAPYYQGGKERMKAGVWNYALTFPIRNFNENARYNDAYFFLIIMLYLLGLVGCVNAVFKGDNE